MYQDIDRLWLRWYDAEDNWVPTDREQLEKERQQRMEAEATLQTLRHKLREQGIDPDTL